MNNALVLIIEDGNEYLENLRAFVPGPTYLQAHDAAEAIDLLESAAVRLIYLDMRFDRVAHSRLVGDHGGVTADHNGDETRAWRFLENNQGLFILAALTEAGYGNLPTILAYDFSREQNRWEHLRETYPRLAWVRDGVSADEIRALMSELLTAPESPR